MDKKEMDYIRGSKSERKTLKHIRKILNDETIQIIKEKYSSMDYVNESNDLKIELKTRYINSDDYYTTMIPESKIKACSDEKISYWFFFRYADNVVKYIKYDKELFNTFVTKISGRTNRGYDERGMYVFIPIRLCETYLI